MKKINLILYVALFIVIILSLLNIGVRLTGKATSASLNVTVSSKVQINFTTNNISFGFGSVTSGNNATIDTLGNVINGNWTPTTTAFVIENAGSVNVSLELKSDKNATTFLSGTDPAFRYNVSEIEANSCNATINLGQWYDVNTTGDGTMICNPFDYTNSRDSIRVDIRLVIPTDSSKGDLQSTFTATGTAV
jgi:hypothetical protein